MQEEIWKPVVGYEGLYEVSNFGRVQTIERIVKFGKVYRKIGKHIPRQFLKGKVGYLFISLSKNSKKTSYLVHRLVAKAFIPNTENKREVNHKNGNKTDNRVFNLEWNTPVENNRHAVKHGLINNFGENSAVSKLSTEDVKQIRFLKKFLSYRKLSLLYGVVIPHVHRIVNRKAWANVL